MNSADAWDAALKIIVAGAGTLGGITLEEALGKALAGVPILTPIASTLSLILAGIVSGVATSVALYALDKWDPFGARDLKKRRHIRQKLEEKKDMHMAKLAALCEEFGIVCGVHETV